MVHANKEGETRPEKNQIWIAPQFEQGVTENSPTRQALERTLKHEMFTSNYLKTEQRIGIFTMTILQSRQRESALRILDRKIMFRHVTIMENVSAMSR